MTRASFQFEKAMEALLMNCTVRKIEMAPNGAGRVVSKAAMGKILYKLLMVEAFSLRESHIIVLHVQSQCCACKAPLQWLHDEKAPKGPLLFGFSNAV